MRSTKFWKIVTFFSLLLTVILIGIFWPKGNNNTPSKVAAVNAAVFSSVAQKANVTFVENKTSDFQSVTLEAGDSIARVFLRLKFSYSELKSIMKLPKMKLYSSKLKEGETLFFKRDAKGELLAIKMQIDLDNDLLIEKHHNRFIEKLQKKPMTSTLVFRSGNVKGSFAKSAGNSGINSALTKEFMQIFHGQINFSKDVHAHDHFSLLYNEYFVNGHAYHSGDIVAAEMMVHHHPYYAFLFDRKGHHAYFNQNGNALKSRFVMPPVQYSRIGSTFSYHRYDPVLHSVRPHLGIDYDAPRGTPVHSIGNGRVAFAGRENGYGNTVIVEYGSGYKALYGHLQSSAKGIHSGREIKQGQVLGYLGSTGWSTGPHLHFELYVNGKPQNPLTLHAVAAQSVPRPYLTKFKRRAKQFIRTMKNHELHHA